MWRRTGPEEFRRGLLPYLWGRTTRSSLAWLSKLASVMLFHATRPAHSMGECARFSLYFERDDRFKTRKGGCSIQRLAGESCFRVSSTDSCIAWIRLPTPLSEKEKGKILLGFFTIMMLFLLLNGVSSKTPIFSRSWIENRFEQICAMNTRRLFLCDKNARPYHVTHSPMCMKKRPTQHSDKVMIS